MKTELCCCLMAAFLAAGSQVAWPCTTTIVTKGASADGSVMVSHSDDGHIEADSSVIYVPRSPIDPAGSRQIYPTAIANGDLAQFNVFLVPRLVTESGAPGYRHPGLSETIAIGSVPYRDILTFLGDASRRETYAYLDGNYGIINEWGVMFGECTNGSKASHDPVPNKRIFYSSELSELALEHCKTAREAVRLIGHLIDTYGYWGTGETLPVGDANEAWVIEMAPVPLDYGKAGGLWVAQKVPDGEFWIAGNEFRIRDIDPAKRNDTLMYGDNLFTVARDLGWYTASDVTPALMDWLATVSVGEYSHPYYSLRRVWRGLSLAAPSLNLNPWVQDGRRGLTRDYPFSVKPDKKMTREDVFAIHRDHYAGTEFDLAVGPGAGPWGNPNRYLGTNDPGGDVGDPANELIGAWERPIGMYYTNLCYVNQAWSGSSSPLNAVTWIALDAPAESVFVPLAVGEIPKIYEHYDFKKFDLEGQAWRIYDLVGEYVNIKYNFMMKAVAEAQQKHESEGARLVSRLRAAGGSRQAALDALNAHALDVHKAWRSLFEYLVANYNQGEVNRAAPADAPPDFGRVHYPDSWLDDAGYFRGPTVYRKKTAGQ